MNKASLIALCIGLFGLLVLSLQALFYGQLYDSGILEWIGPGTFIVCFSLVCVAVGVVGVVAFPFELAIGDYRYAKLKAPAFLLYVTLFCWVFLKYATAL